MADDIAHTGAHMALPTTLAELVAARTRAQGHRPLLTWYDELTGARTELSYATADNWAAKTANMLAEEFDAGPGTTVALDLDGHWISVALVVACWKLGATICVDGDADLVCCHETRVDAYPNDPVVVVGDGFTGEPTGHVPERDGLVLLGLDVHSHADDYDDPDVAGSTGALRLGGATRSHEALLDSARAWYDVLGATPRVGLAAPLDHARVSDLLAGVLAASGGIVAMRAHDDPRYGTRWTSERVTAVVAASRHTSADAPADATLLTFDAVTA